MVSNNIFKIAVLFVTMLFVVSCSNLDNPKERNKIVFKDSAYAVADSIKVMNELLFKTGRVYYIYAIDNNKLFINDNRQYAKELGTLSDTSLYKNRWLAFIDTSERKHFVALTKYLNDNYLSRCDIENGQPIYMYRADIYMADRQTDLDRFIVFVNSEQEIDLNHYKILDRSRKLYLLADKDAKIWNNK